MKKPYLEHLKSSKDLQTSYAAVRAGFVALALEKNRRATPFVEQARTLKAAASKAKTRPRPESGWKLGFGATCIRSPIRPAFLADLT
jgi:hypothetical protein